METFLRWCAAISTILVLITNIATFLNTFGVDVIFTPSQQRSPVNPFITIKTPIEIDLGKVRLPLGIDLSKIEVETVTFIFLFYLVIATIVLLWWLEESVSFGWRYGWQWFLSTPLFGGFLALVSALFAIWLWGFWYIPLEVYVFFLPTAIFFGMGEWHFVVRRALHNEIATPISILFVFVFINSSDSF